MKGKAILIVFLASSLSLGMTGLSFARGGGMGGGMQGNRGGSGGSAFGSRGSFHSSRQGMSGPSEGGYRQGDRYRDRDHDQYRDRDQLRNRDQSRDRNRSGGSYDGNQNRGESSAPVAGDRRNDTSGNRYGQQDGGSHNGQGEIHRATPATPAQPGNPGVAATPAIPATPGGF